MTDHNELVRRLLAAAKPERVFAGVSSRGAVYRTDKPKHHAILREAATAISAAESRAQAAADDMSRHYTNIPQAPLIDAINKLPVIDAWAKAEWLTDPLTWQFKLLRWENHGRRGAPKMEAAE